MLLNNLIIEFFIVSKLDSMKFDRYDRHILQLLQQDAGLSNLQLAEQVGLSPSPCLRRVQKLEEAGVITSRVALLNDKALGLGLTVLIQISMDRHTPERFENFGAHVRSFDEVQQCYLITGQSADYLLKVTVPDMDHYQSFLLDKLTRIEGVTGVHSSFVMRKVVDSSALPLNYL